ncbi:TPA: hypothetical protein DDY55_05695 [Candidatus Falkowbacteria bacterium]|nr:hypothetical protein [Candidatus Falkowbacteria bacterium]HAY11998.1 hypothetical protein [Candidatus Falkowbacteria bacterium]HBI97567.1 hypothetical protein [Candidatus Falkowbacteria bacterium]HBT27803.1 hypothetical protein [Candidatus Falkowbacteria bacterium]HBY15377.1 hypothetical protein [Candidatus Falkowbacteria bacterium]
MVAEAKKIIPKIEAKDIDIVVYGGDRHPYTIGIEFECNFYPNSFLTIEKIEDELRDKYAKLSGEYSELKTRYDTLGLKN